LIKQILIVMIALPNTICGSSLSSIIHHDEY
jgi:hypothetical protein